MWVPSSGPSGLSHACSFPAIPTWPEACQACLACPRHLLGTIPTLGEACCPPTGSCAPLAPMAPCTAARAWWTGPTVCPTTATLPWGFRCPRCPLSCNSLSWSLTWRSVHDNCIIVFVSICIFILFILYFTLHFIFMLCILLCIFMHFLCFIFSIYTFYIYFFPYVAQLFLCCFIFQRPFWRWDPPSNVPDAMTSFRRTKPRLYRCYICGSEFGTASLPIHVKSCFKLRREIWERAAPRVREREPLPDDWAPAGLPPPRRVAESNPICKYCRRHRRRCYFLYYYPTFSHLSHENFSWEQENQRNRRDSVFHFGSCKTTWPFLTGWCLKQRGR